MESFVDNLKKEVQCSLCNDTLTEPKILSCFHTFCKPCIKRHAEHVDQINIFKCPRCKSQTSLPELSSVEDLQPSLVHSRMLKGLASVEREKICSVSENHSSASWYCFDCDHSLCQECEKSHSFFIKDHKIVRLDDLKKEDIELIITRENPCTSHPHHRLEFFCEDCDELICGTCLKHDHRNHKTKSLEEFASIEKGVLSQYLQVLEELRLDDKGKQQQETIANSIKQQGEKAKTEVKDRTKKMIEMLQENEQELLRQIDEKLGTATTNLNIIHHLSAVEEYIQNVMERGLASEMIQATSGSQKFIFNPIPLLSGIEYVANEELLRQVKLGVGEIQTCPSLPDHTKTTVELKSETEHLKKEKLIVTTEASAGELNHDPNDDIDVQIKPEENVNIKNSYLIMHAAAAPQQVEPKFPQAGGFYMPSQMQQGQRPFFGPPVLPHWNMQQSLQQMPLLAPNMPNYGQIPRVGGVRVVAPRGVGQQSCAPQGIQGDRQCMPMPQQPRAVSDAANQNRKDTYKFVNSKKENLVAITKSSEGDLNHDPGDVIDVQIKPEENVKIEKKNVRSDGKVEIEFMAKVTGRLTVEVQMNGNRVSNSPKELFNMEGVMQGIQVLDQDPLRPSDLVQATLQEQKQMLGERLFPLIQNTHPDLAGKITGMLLEIDNTELLHMLESQEALQAKVEEAVRVLKLHHGKTKLGSRKNSRSTKSRKP